MNVKEYNNFVDRIINNEDDSKIVKGRYDIGKLSLELKINFINHLIGPSKSIDHLVYRILFWEEDKIIQNFIKDKLPITRIEMYKSYSGKEDSGIFFVIDEYKKTILSTILCHHFNYELGKNPALNLRVQICLIKKNSKYVLDIYDDRGFDFYTDALE